MFDCTIMMVLDRGGDTIAGNERREGRILQMCVVNTVGRNATGDMGQNNLYGEQCYASITSVPFTRGKRRYPNKGTGVTVVNQQYMRD